MKSAIVDNDDGTTTLTYAWPENPVGFRVNSLRNMHHRVFAEKNAYWRDETFAKLAAGSPALQWAVVQVDEVVPTRTLPDWASSCAAIKAGIDGLVRLGILPGDSPEYVRAGSFSAPTYEKGEAWLVLSLTGPRVAG